MWGWPSSRVDLALSCWSRCMAPKYVALHASASRPPPLAMPQADRINYLLTKQAKIVAMTCTHAALEAQVRQGDV